MTETLAFDLSRRRRARLKFSGLAEAARSVLAAPSIRAVRAEIAELGWEVRDTAERRAQELDVSLDEELLAFVLDELLVQRIGAAAVCLRSDLGRYERYCIARWISLIRSGLSRISGASDAEDLTEAIVLVADDLHSYLFCNDHLVDSSYRRISYERSVQKSEREREQLQHADSGALA
jgi:hypothetical protein